MRRSALFLALVAVGFGFIGEQAAAAKSKAGHKFKGSIQYPASYGFGQDFPVALVGEAGQPGLKN